jgi:hypothetical protein
VADVTIIGGSLPVLPGTASSEVASGEDLLGGGRSLRQETFCSALPLSLKFHQFRRGGTASASVLLGNNPPALFVALWFLN